MNESEDYKRGYRLGHALGYQHGITMVLSIASIIIALASIGITIYFK